MSNIRRNTMRLPDDLVVTILQLPAGLTVAALRGMLNAELYVLLGHTTSADSTSGQASTGFGAYVGVSDVLDARTQRAGVSLHTWANRLGRLQPTTVVLIRREGRPIGRHARLLVEAALIRAISGAQYTVLNIRTAAPDAARRATRRERLWALHTSDRLARLIRGRVLVAHPPTATGGSTREQLVRLVLRRNQPMSVEDVLEAAANEGIVIRGESPAQRSRRDLTIREFQDGTPRIYRMHIGGRCIVYPAHMSRSEARRAYIAAQSGPLKPRESDGGRRAS